MSTMLHRARWIVPMEPGLPELIEDGGILCNDKKVIKVGFFKDLQRENALITHHEGIIVPALINAHIHLELSHLAVQQSEDTNLWQPGDIASWIGSLLAKRQEITDPDNARKNSQKALDFMYQQGCAVALDIGNQLESKYIGESHTMDVHFFLEILGLSRFAQDKAFAVLAKLPDSMNATAHALYSTGTDMLKALKKRCVKTDTVFPLHVAESHDEITFLQNGTGKIRELLEQRDAWDGTFAPPGTGAVHYLENLGLLDEKTLCVHAVHVNSDEISILAKKRAKVCLCPGSNRYLGIGKAPVEEYLNNEMLPALGTDSAASNPSLSIWREMRLLLEDHPEVDPVHIFAMATQGGAQALGLEKEMGGLGPGKKAVMLLISCPEIPGKDIFQYLVNAGDAEPIKWL